MLAGISIDMINTHSDCHHKISSKTKNWTTVIKEIKSFLQIQIKIGYALDYKSIECKLHQENIRWADFLVINHRLCTNDNVFVESFGIFKKQIEQITDKVSDFTRMLNAQYDCIVYYNFNFEISCELDQRKFDVCKYQKHAYGDDVCTQNHLLTMISNDPNMSLVSNQRYKGLFTKYLLEWAMIQNDKFVIQNYEYIFSNLPEDLMMQVFPYVADSQITESQIAAGLLLEEIAKSGFQTIVVEERLAQMLKNCTDKYNVSKLCNSLKAWNITFFTTDIWSIGQQEYTRITKRKFKINKENSSETKQLLFQLSVGSCESSQPQNCAFDGYNEALCGYCFATLLLHKNRVDKYVNETALVWKGNLTFTEMNFKVDVFVNEIMKRLKSFVIAKQILNVEYPNIKSRIHFAGQAYPAIKNQGNLYCSQSKEKYSQLYDAILTWADIHEFPITLEPFNELVDHGNPLAWERLMSRDMSIVMTKQPVYVRRQYNQTKIFGRWAQGAYPCVKKSDNKSSIETLTFDDKYLGVTLDFHLRPENETLLKTEFQTLLFMAMSKFQSVQIILEVGQFELFKDIVESTNFATNLKQNSIKTTSLYLQVESNLLDKKRALIDIISILENEGFVVRVMYTLAHNDRVSKELKDFDKNGIVHPNCNILSRQIAFYPSEVDEKMKDISFIICETKPVVASNFNETKMENIMNAHLYMSKIISYYYPSIKEIHFRLQLRFTQHYSEENLLLFLADLVKYAKAYEIYYFLLPAFVDEKHKNSVASFWRISNYSNLADTSVFEEYLAKYLNLNTSVPLLKHVYKSKLSESINTTSFVIIVSIIAALVICTIIFLALYKAHQKRQTISEKEIDAFYNGHNETLELAARECQVNETYNRNIFDGLVYQKEYELSQAVEDINLQYILHDGKFATVYRTKIHGIETDVAVKITSRKCSKQIFKGFLSDVKTLCYIGEHLNLVSFIGCYSQEITNHVLWIVIEYCGKGTLLDYLNGLKLLSKEEWSVQQLFRFSGEVASGMNYISSQNTIHGGLCAKHILLTQNLTCKISSLSFARKLTEYQTHFNNNSYEKLPWQWMAPESLRKLEFSPMSDVWSYGVILWEIFNIGEVPYPNVKLSTRFINDLEKGMRMEIPTYATKETYNLMLQCWDRAPNGRPQFPTLVEYFTGKPPERLNNEPVTTELDTATSIVHQ